MTDSHGLIRVGQHKGGGWHTGEVNGKVYGCGVGMTDVELFQLRVGGNAPAGREPVM